jgi:hypothetical protein
MLEWIKFLAAYPSWIKVVVPLCFILIVFLMVYYAPKAEITSSDTSHLTEQTANVANADNVIIYQAAGNIHVGGQDSAIETIQSIQIEARLTCTLKSGATLPPSEVDFIPAGDSHAYLTNGQEKVRLNFASPVRFRSTADTIVVTNNFLMQGDSSLLTRPIDTLSKFNVLSLPVVTVAYGASLDYFTFLEVTVTVNHKDIWYQGYKYHDQFKSSLRFEIPLDEFRQRLADIRN